MKFNNQTIEYALLGAATLLILSALIGYLIFRRTKISYDIKWKDLQQFLQTQTTWKDAIFKADELLDQRLKERHFKGKTMGERLVSAQHELSANDMVWYSHKLRNKIDSESIPLSKKDVRQCLLGFWQALKDLEAFKKEP